MICIKLFYPPRSEGDKFDIDTPSIERWDLCFLLFYLGENVSTLQATAEDVPSKVVQLPHDPRALILENQLSQYFEKSLATQRGHGWWFWLTTLAVLLPTASFNLISELHEWIFSVIDCPGPAQLLLHRAKMNLSSQALPTLQIHELNKWLLLF